jgi:hypothetical protein
LLVGSAVANATAASQPVSRICAEDAQALKSLAEQQPVHATLRATALRLAASYEKRRSCGPVRITTRDSSALIDVVIETKPVAGGLTMADVLGIVGVALVVLASIAAYRRRPRQAAPGA